MFFVTKPQNKFMSTKLNEFTVMRIPELYDNFLYISIVYQNADLLCFYTIKINFRLQKKKKKKKKMKKNNNPTQYIKQHKDIIGKTGDL
jgi:hypothetical protein